MPQMRNAVLVAVLVIVLGIFFQVELTMLRGVAKAELCPGTIPTDSAQLAACNDETIAAKVKTLDTHTLYMFNKFKTGYMGEGDPNVNIPKAQDVMYMPLQKRDWPKKLVPGIGFDMANGTTYTMQVMTRDVEDYPDYYDSMASTIAGWIFRWLHTGMFHPLQDHSETWDSAEQAGQALAAAVGHDLDQRLLVKNTDHASDEAISRWAYSGMAAHRLQCPGLTGYKVNMGFDVTPVEKKADEHCMLDFSWLAPFEVREGFEKYGVIAYFDADRKLTKMYWSHGDKMVHPGDAEWDHVKWAFKTSVLVGVTARDHLCDTHHIASEQLCIASKETLNKDHPLRRLTKPFVYGTADINSASTKTLVVENSLVHRATSWTWDAIQQAFSVMLVTDRFLPSTKEYMKLMGTDKLPTEKYPLGEDWQEFEAVMHEFVKNYVDLYYPDDAAVAADGELQKFWVSLHLPDANLDVLSEQTATMVKKAKGGSPTSFMRNKVETKVRLVHVLSSFFIAVTGLHNQVGNIGEYITNPTFSGAKIRPGATMSDVQGSFQVLNVGLATAAKRPMLLDSVDHLLLDQGAKDVWANFHKDLRELADRIDKRNEKRGTFQCNAMNPKKMLSSVSI